MEEILRNQKEYAKLYHEQRKAYKTAKQKAEKQRAKDKKEKELTEKQLKE